MKQAYAVCDYKKLVLFMMLGAIVGLFGRDGSSEEPVSAKVTGSNKYVYQDLRELHFQEPVADLMVRAR